MTEPDPGHGNPLPERVPAALAPGEVAVIPLTAAAGLVLLLIGYGSKQAALEYVGVAFLVLSLVAVVVVAVRARRRRRLIAERSQ